jgi:hypothetical protein
MRYDSFGLHQGTDRQLITAVDRRAYDSGQPGFVQKFDGSSTQRTPRLGFRLCLLQRLDDFSRVHGSFDHGLPPLIVEGRFLASPY